MWLILITVSVSNELDSLV